MSTSAFSYLLENIPGMYCDDADFADLDGNPDEFILAQKFFTARKYRLVYSVKPTGDPDTTSGDVTLPFNSGDAYSANQDPWQRWQMTNFRPYRDDGGSASDTNSPYITNLDPEVDVEGVMFAMGLAVNDIGVFKFLPWMQICVPGALVDPTIIASRYQPEFEDYTQIGTVALLGLTIPVWTATSLDSWSLTLDDSIPNAYWLPGDFV